MIPDIGGVGIKAVLLQREYLTPSSGFGFLFPAGTLTIVIMDSKDVRWMYFVSKESNCKYLFM